MVQCHVYGGAKYGQWIDVGQNFTIAECSKGEAVEIWKAVHVIVDDQSLRIHHCSAVSCMFSVCQEDGTVDCKKSRECLS